MFDRLLPKAIDNSYRGHWLALWFLGLVLAMRLAINTNSMLNSRSVAINADGIPVDHYGGGGAEAVVSLFALLGLSQLLLALFGVVALIRYRAMVPLMFLLLLADQVGRRILVTLHPVARAGATTVGAFSVGTLINYGMLAILVIGLALSLLDRPRGTA